MAKELAIGVKIRGKDDLSGVAKRASGKAAAALQKLEKRFGKPSMMGTAMIAGGLYAVQRAFTATLAPAMAFEDQLAAVRSIAPGTLGSVAADMEAIQGSARNWAKQHSESAAAFTQASYQMLSAGLNTTQAIAATETALSVATGTMGDATETAQFLATVYNTLGDKTKPATAEMQRLGDVIVRTQQYFQLPNLQRLSDGMTYAIPVAMQFGMTLEQTAAIVGQLNTMGMQGSIAGNAFASAMGKMIPASKKLGFEIARANDGGVDFAGTIDNIKQKFGDKLGTPKVQQALQSAFGQRGVRAISLMLAKVDDLRAGYDQVSNSVGAMEAAQKTMEATTSSALATAKNNLAELSIQFGEVALPMVNGAIPRMVEGMEFLNEHWELVLAGMTAATMAFAYKTLPPLLISSAQMIMAHPAIAGLAAVAAAAATAAELADAYQKKKHRRLMGEGNIGVFEGPGGAQAAMKALDEAQKKAIAGEQRGGAATTSGGGQAEIFTPAPVISSFSGAGMAVADVGGNITISFANAPAGMAVSTIETTSPGLSLTVKGDTGKNKTGSGGM